MPPRRGVGVLWTSRSRMPGYSLYFRLSRQTPHESAEGDGRGEDDREDVLLHGAVRLLRVRLEQVAQDLAQARAVDGALAEHADERLGAADEARRVDDRRGDAGGGRAGVEVHRDAVAEHPLRIVRRDRRRLAGEVRARDRERARLLEELEGDPVRGHPHRDGAAGLAEIPCQRRLRREDDRESARPELLDEPLDGLGHLRDERAKRGQTRPRGRAAATAVRVPSPRAAGRRPPRRMRRRRRRTRCRSGGRRARRGRWPGAPDACRRGAAPHHGNRRWGTCRTHSRLRRPR